MKDNHVACSNKCEQVSVDSNLVILIVRSIGVMGATDHKNHSLDIGSFLSHRFFETAKNKCKKKGEGEQIQLFFPLTN